MDDEANEHAVAAHIAYTYYENGYEKAQEELTRHLPDGDHSIDVELSDERSVTLTRSNGAAILAYRGTDPTNIYDLGADALIMMGYHRERPLPGIYTRFQAATDAYSLAKNKHGADVTVAGHSLGGTLADYVGRMYDVRAYAFNAGETPFEFARGGRSTDAGKTQLFTTDGIDPISISGYAHHNSRNIIVVPQSVSGFFGAHDRRNFLNKPSPIREPGAELRERSTIARSKIATGAEPGAERGAERSTIARSKIATGAASIAKSSIARSSSAIEAQMGYTLCELYPRRCPKGQ